MLVSWVIEPLLWPPGQKSPGRGSPGHCGDVRRCSASANSLFSPVRPPRQEPTFVEALLPQPGVEGLDHSVVCRFARTAEVQLHTVQVRPLVPPLGRELWTVVLVVAYQTSSMWLSRRHSAPSTGCGRWAPSDMLGTTACVAPELSSTFCRVAKSGGLVIPWAWRQRHHAVLP